MADEAAYTTVVSAKARHVRLRVSLRDGSLTVVVPKGFDRREIPKVVEERRRWVERVQRKVAEQREMIDPEDARGLPALIRLRAVDEEWRVEYRKLRSDATPAPDPDDGRQALVIYGAIEDEAACTQAVCGWLHDKARAHLKPWLTDLSAQHDLPVARIAVKSQRTRWGSCSERNGINLNRKLLFLPPPMVEQVMLHELCHTVHHNHSERFWRLLGSLSPDAQTLEKALRTAWRYVPAWLDR